MYTVLNIDTRSELAIHAWRRSCRRAMDDGFGTVGDVVLDRILLRDGVPIGRFRRMRYGQWEEIHAIRPLTPEELALPAVDCHAANDFTAYARHVVTPDGVYLWQCPSVPEWVPAGTDEVLACEICRATQVACAGV